MSEPKPFPWVRLIEEILAELKHINAYQATAITGQLTAIHAELERANELYGSLVRILEIMLAKTMREAEG